MSVSDNSLKIRQALKNVMSALDRIHPEIGDRLTKMGTPEFRDMEWKYVSPPCWDSSFWPAKLWLLYRMTGESRFRNTARLCGHQFQEVLDNRDIQCHDLGFQFSLTAVADYKLTGDTKARDMGVAAAEALFSRYRKGGKFLVAWNEGHHWPISVTQYMAIIDSLQNLALLFWASEETGRADYRNAAIGHADTLLEHIIREDNSTYHCLHFDPKTLQFSHGATAQGYADESCWSRGQSWAVHGFAQIYAYTKDEKYLKAAKRLADYVIDHLPEDGVPVWDYKLPKDQVQHRDSSAGAITAAGMLLIASLCTDEAEKAHYTKWGEHMLLGLIDNCDITGNQEALGLLAEGAAHVKVGNFNQMLSYGDYYYMEALMRASGHTRFFW